MKEDSSVAESPNDGLEDLLIYDDIFLDYFNAFLALPAFPQTLQYHRLTGTFQISETNKNTLVECTSPLYGATDAERERIMTWACNERLPLFLNTELFRELKLCKLLVRPLEERQLTSRGTNIRGYSRQTQEDGSSFSNTTDHSQYSDSDDDESGDDDDDTNETGNGVYTIESNTQDENMDEAYINGLFYDSFHRPGSRALSLPAQLPVATISGSKNGALRIKDSRKSTSIKQKSNTEKQVDRDVTFASSKDSFAISKEAKRQSLPITKRTVYSAPINYAEFLRLPVYSDFEFEYGKDVLTTRRPLVAFAADENPLSENDVRSIEGRQNVSFQRLKELLIGSRASMQDFLNFLKPTAGIHLVDFWLDCEFYKDTFANREESENTATRNRLFRDLQDKYRLRLTEEAKRQIRLAADDTSQANSLFLRTQYDVLRRLRAYWLPRFVLHQEHEVASQTLGDLQNAWLTEQLRASQSSQAGALFPSLSLVNSMHVRPEQSVAMVANGADWGKVAKAGRQFDERVQSAKRVTSNLVDKDNTPGMTLKFKLRAALTVDKIAGGPFQKFLEELPEKKLLNCLLFFQEVEEYACRERRSSDRLLRLGHAWNICNRYLVQGARFHIGFHEKGCNAIVNTIRKARDLVATSEYQLAQDFAVKQLETMWLRFLKEDVKKFVESSTTHRNVESPPKTAEDFEVVIEGDRIIVRRIEKKLLSSARTVRQRTWDLLTDDEKAERRRLAAERRKVMEKERRKAIKAAYQRIKDMEKAGKIKNHSKVKESQEDEVDSDESGRQTSKSLDSSEIVDEPLVVEEEKPPELKEMLNSKAVMALFKKYLGDKDGKDGINLLTLYQEVLNYQSMPSGDKVKTNKKDAQAHYIFKTFLDKSSRRYVELRNERVQTRLTLDKGRPKSVTMKDMVSFMYAKLSAIFSSFWTYQSEELGTDMNALRHMSEKELMMRSDNNMVGTINVKGKVSGRAQPTKDDKVEFLMLLEQSVSGPLSIQMLYFYRYLIKYAVEDGFPNLDKNLFFYVEVQKFKELAQGKCDEEFLKRKVQCICSTFLESVYLPTLQISVSSEMHQRMLRNANRYSTIKEMSHTIFDEGQFVCFKELLPYFAGFLRQWEPPTDVSYRPVTRYQQLLEKRLDLFHNMPEPAVDFKLPKVPRNGVVTSFTFSLLDGVKWKSEEKSDNLGPQATQPRDQRRLITSIMEAASSIPSTAT